MGLHYDLFEDGVPLRVLVLGMEMGRPDRDISLEARRLQQDEAIGMRFGARHAHMLSTTSALRAAFGQGLGDDRAGELLQLSNDPVPQHVMQCYALVNERLCSAVRPPEPPKRRRFQAAKVPAMDRACLPHLAATVRILEPTLVILQSKALRPLIRPHLKRVERIDPANELLEYAEFAGVPTVVANFSHPAAYAPTELGQLAPQRLRGGCRGADVGDRAPLPPHVAAGRAAGVHRVPTAFALLTLPTWVSSGPTATESLTPLTCSPRKSTSSSTGSWTA